MGRLQDKVAVITGGNSGVGAAAAELFAKEGAKVVISARRENKLEEVATKIKEAGGEVYTVACDISKVGDAENLVNKTLEKYGRIDVFVNNAGILEEGLKPIDKMTNEDLDRVIDTNEKGTMYCMRAACRAMEEKGGSIVNVASSAGIIGNGGAAYVASKSAILGITTHTALRYAGKGIRCNAVCPGSIATPMLAGSSAENQDKDMFGQLVKHSDLKVGISMPQDVANIILFLASDESRSMTGQKLVCDFGAAL